LRLNVIRSNRICRSACASVGVVFVEHFVHNYSIIMLLKCRRVLQCHIFD
jgi:hypothetical protein